MGPDDMEQDSMSRTDRILLRSDHPEKVRELVIDLSERCTHVRPAKRTARLRREAEGCFSLQFSEPLAAAQFTNLIGHLSDASEIEEVTGWFDGADDIRYQLTPDSKSRSDGVVHFLVGVTDRGSCVDLYLPESFLCEVSTRSAVFEEPDWAADAAVIDEWEVEMDGDRFPLLAPTHPKDHDWS